MRALPYAMAACRYLPICAAFLTTNLAGRATAAEPSVLTAAELEAIWEDLVRDDEVGARQAYEHVRTLAHFPHQTVDFLRGHLRPVPAPDPQRLPRLIADLNSVAFARRAAASAELEKMGPLVGQALRKELLRAPPLEVTRRIEDLLKRLDQACPSAVELRGLRAVEALEAIRSPEARKLLEELARGAEGAELTRRARAALRK